MRTGLFVGTFDPFTLGHDSIVRRALPLFDNLVIGVGVNPDKHTMLSAAERVQRIADLYADISAVSVMAFEGLTIDLAKQVGAHYIIKGVRSVTDFEYERAQADFNRRMGGIETLLLYAEPQLESLSSSMVRTLQAFGRSTDEYLPHKK
ncbi:MAG: pantetheine-phosphate adenylyltransferase [Prevotellaceae bacterium]|nr:pantetheine-phosphate adenylyltransferase [Prevotellaceae bacterium]